MPLCTYLFGDDTMYLYIFGAFYVNAYANILNKGGRDGERERERVAKGANN